MAESGVYVTVNGLAEYEAFMANLPDIIAGGIQDAAPYAASLVTADQGGGHPFYPSTTDHNSPPAPYYERYVGEYMPGGTVASFSEQMGERFDNFVEGWDLHITNSASYAEKVIGELQDPFFAAIGWQRLGDVAANVIDGIVAWYENTIQARIDARGGGPT